MVALKSYIQYSHLVHWKPCRFADGSHISMCMCNSAWEASEAFKLDLETLGQDDEQNRAKRCALDEWAKSVNQHGGFGRWSSAVSFDPGDGSDILTKARLETREPGRQECPPRKA